MIRNNTIGYVYSTTWFYYIIINFDNQLIKEIPEISEFKKKNPKISFGKVSFFYYHKFTIFTF